MRRGAGPSQMILGVPTSRDLVEVCWPARTMPTFFAAPPSLPRFTPELNCRSTLPMSPRGALAAIQYTQSGEQFGRAAGRAPVGQLRRERRSRRHKNYAGKP